MAKIVELRKLSKEFYKAYPRNKFPEMEAKLGRPYVVLLVEINNVKILICTQVIKYTLQSYNIQVIHQ